MKIIKSILSHINQPVSSLKIAMFRIAFALVLFMQAFYFYVIDFIKIDIIESNMHFSYPYLEFIKVGDPLLMQGLLILMFISSISLLVGFKARLSSFVYFIAFTYLWLIDKGFYNNHYYLISLLTLVMCFIHSDGKLSVNERNELKENHRWEEYILLFQFSIVLFYAGLNKMNVWWLVYHEPIQHILMYKAQINSNELWNSKFLEFILIWGGLFFDLLIVPLLLINRTRIYAMILFVFFNGINTILFYDVGEIGIFPLLMMSSLILFIPNEVLSRLLFRFFKYKQNTKRRLNQTNKTSFLLTVPLFIFVLLQLALPFRHLIYEGYVDYTGEAQRFSWRMKSMYKDFSISFILKDEKRGIEANLDPRTVLSVKQYTNLGYYPELIIPVAENLRLKAIEKGVEDPKIYVDYKVGFMGLTKHYIIDPNRELSTINFSPFKHSEWIIPLDRSLGKLKIE
jgi:uncharacterized membrane protein YphA (DoxX/SURF4 family)